MKQFANCMVHNGNIVLSAPLSIEEYTKFLRDLYTENIPHLKCVGFSDPDKIVPAGVSSYAQPEVIQRYSYQILEQVHNMILVNPINDLSGQYTKINGEKVQLIHQPNEAKAGEFVQKYSIMRNGEKSMYIINQRLRNTAYAQLCIDKRTQFEESARHSKYIAMLNSPDYPDVETGLRFDNFNMQDTEYSDLSFFCESAVDSHLPAVEEKPIFLTDGTLNVWYKAHRFPNLVFFFCTKPNGHANSGSVKEKLFGTKDIDVTVIEHPDWDLTKYFVVNVGEIDTTAPIENIPLVYRKPINEKALELILQNYGGLE